MSAALLEWKEEPVSPLTADEDATWVSEETLYFSNFDEHAAYFKLETENEQVEDDGDNEEACESKAEIASKLLDDLDQLEDLDEWIKSEEPFQNWLDDKMLPMLDDVEPAHCIPAIPVKMEEMKTATVPDTRILLKEFETVLDAVEMTHSNYTTPPYDQLTPPQSPPYEQQQQQPILTTLETIPAQQQAVYHVPEGQIVPNNMLPYPHTPLNISLDYPVVNTPQPDVARELAVVDELVRSRIDDMVHWSGPSSPSSSSSSNFGDCSSSEDPEWIPESVDAQQELEISGGKPSRKRAKPYSRTCTEDKKSRKKEQNKNAATRYRMKKKAEIEEILDEERKLQTIKEELENKMGDVQKEIKYLKGLMRELFKAKGLIN